MGTRMELDTVPTTVAEQPRVELNEADAEELATLSGIGPVLAARIVDYREEHGPFLVTEDVRQVPGVGDAVYDDIRDRLTATVPTASELTDISIDDEPDNGTAPEFDVTAIERETPDDAFSPESTEAETAYTTPPPLPVSATTQLPSTEETSEETYATPPPLPVSATWQAEPEEIAEEETEEQEPLAESPEQQVARSEPKPKQDTGTGKRGFGWVWTALLGAALGAVLGMVLALLIFAGINGSVDVSRSRAMTQMRGQMSALNVELDAIRGDVSTLQGDISGLRERVEVLSGLTTRMEQAEDALATFTGEIQTLQDETAALTTSLGTLADDVDDMGATLDAVEAQTEKATTFFEGLQGLMQDIFGQPAEPQGAAPAAAEEVDA